MPYFACSFSFYELGKCLSGNFMINCISIFKKVKMKFMFSHNKKTCDKKWSYSRAIFYQPLFAEIDNVCYAVVLLE